ncbi:MAG TPA: division/cell wall cluster transcriptional repressor MraZ [Candidatus Limnocylindrales bacterium]|nr:division/cell wall cluster transcriptional repressor MraZ [Candidatus Limnocylindrales bacterium]
MFLGTYRHSVDTKGRLAIPARFREQLPSGSVIAKGAEGCLQIYPREEWGREQDSQRLSSLSPAEERRLARMMFGAARECEFDAQGRIVLSADHRSYAGITSVAWIVGVNNLIEIWNDEDWRRIGDATAEEYTRIQDQVAERRRAREH